MSNAMHILRDRAKERGELLAQKLASARQQLTEAEGKLKLLEDYQAEQQDKHQHITQTKAITGFQLQNQTAFVQKIIDAIQLQHKQIEQIRHTEQHYLESWQTALQEEKKYDALIERDLKKRRARTLKIEQKMNDEFAARIHRIQASGGLQ